MIGRILLVCPPVFTMLFYILLYLLHTLASEILGLGVEKTERSGETMREKEWKCGVD